MKVSIVAVSLGLCLVACGGSSDNGPDPSSTSIVNGASRLSTTSVWTSSSCAGISNVRIAFGDDGTGFQRSGGTCLSGTGPESLTWTEFQTNVSITNSVSDINCLASIAGVSGSTASGSFVGTGFRSDGFSAGSCTFTLANGTP